MKNMFLALACFALVACGGKNDAVPSIAASGGSSAQSAAAPATPPPLIPSSMRGAYVTDDYKKNKLAVSATGISRSGIYSGSLTMNVGRIDGTSYIVDGSEYSGDKSRSGNNNF